MKQYHNRMNIALLIGGPSAFVESRRSTKKGVNSLIILTSWLIWKHRNSSVFDGATPSVNEVLRQFRDEYKLWCLAGAKKLLALCLDWVGTFG